ncbi:toll/interleukin-1 receptor domain-containing protein [Aridibaculum aurantiacum]|uniref:toll/interleukin-1 receptor domain-containing protein n=1 Tax=Aridibaculum aurantiacum TaxID=2810307 RepID=UPI001A95D416|nr:toll/interleukin-1 receptor domain-containing protein [Aridibaculum aurantiacum]
MKIFISYSRSTQNEVRMLVKDLEELDHEVWYDNDLSGGQSWWDRILMQIRECDVFLFGLSVEALDSTACIREMKYAEALGKQPFPVLLKQGVSISIIPRYLSHLHYVNYTDPNNKQAALDLHKGLRKLPPSPPLPDPLPEPPAVPISYLDTLKEKIDTPNLGKNDQAIIVRELRNKLADKEVNKEDVVGLLYRLKKHDDLFASVAVEVDEMIKEVSTNTPPKPAPIKEHRPHIPPIKQNEHQHTFIPNHHNHQDRIAIPEKDTSWSIGTMAALLIGTLIFPIVGIVAGIMRLVNGSVTQGIVLLGTGLFMALVYGLMYL